MIPFIVNVHSYMLRTLTFLILLITHSFSFGQTIIPKNSSEIKAGLEKLNVLGSVLYFAAHPDDENTKLIAWLANEKKYETAYLSLTRGDGGQNLIGTEMGIELGLIRTQELLAARRIDGGNQYFSSAYDFGFSKTFEETFAFWNKEETLRESVWLIRKLRPDVIITRFPPDPRGGHGHHQASAILAHEAFIAAADPKRFPEQLDELDVWQAKRLLWNTANFGGQNNTSDDQLKIETGDFNTLLGASYGEVSAISRSQHKSQGFGSASSRGQSIEYFEHVAGEPAKQTLLDGVTTDWSRIANAGLVAQQIADLNKTFDMSAPQKSIPALLALHKSVQNIADKHWRAIKTQEIEELILACAGFYIDNYTLKPVGIVGESVEVFQEIIVRNPNIVASVERIGTQSIRQTLENNKTFRHQYQITSPAITQPFWLRKPYTLGKFDVEEADFGAAESSDRPQTEIVITIDGLPIVIHQPITHRYVDPVRGEIHNPLHILPQITASAAQSAILLADKGQPQKLEVTFTRHDNSDQVEVSVNVPTGLAIAPSKAVLSFGKSKSITQSFEVKAAAGGPAKASEASAQDISFSIGKDTIRQYRLIEYNHIPSQAWFPMLAIKAEKIDLNVPVKRVAYVTGAGDRVPESLRAVGMVVDVIRPQEISTVSAAQYDALIVGIRAYNVHANLTEYTPALLRYAEAGGTVLAQYQVNSGVAGKDIGPYPFQVTRARVTEEDADVKFLLPNDPSLQKPNKITEADFANWIQERGLYFVENTDATYRKPLSMHDKNETAHDGSLIIARYGKGKFVYTSLAFFRQLPAGVPGAYRLFVNLLAKEE